MRKGEKFVWDEEREKSFEELNKRLVSAPILTLPSGSGGFHIYSNASKKGLGCVLMQHGKVIAYASRKLKPYEANYPTHDLELAAVDYDTDIQYHLGKANAVADALSRKSGMLANLQIELEIIRDLERMDIELCIRGTKGYWDVLQKSEEDEQMKFRVDNDGVMWFGYRLCVPNDPTLREAVLSEAHSSPFSIHLDFVTGLPRTQKKNDAFWVVVDRLTKSAHFLPIRKDFSISRLADIFQQEIVRLHGTPAAIVSDRDPHLRLAFGRTLGDMLRSCALKWTGNWDEYLCLVEFAYNNSWHASIKAASYELLYGQKCRAPISWNEVGEHVIEGSELIEIREDLSLVEKPKKILDRQERVMRNKIIPFVKIIWKNHPEREAT
nr:hypothetical protein [Tanacetum cinerariifolium]